MFFISRFVAFFVLFYMTLSVPTKPRWYMPLFMTPFIQIMFVITILLSAFMDPVTGLIVTCILIIGITQARHLIVNHQTVKK
jgi:hypothetical protein